MLRRKKIFKLKRRMKIGVGVCVGGAGCTIVLTENVLLDLPEKWEETTPVHILGRNILGRGQADAEVWRWGGHDVPEIAMVVLRKENGK